MPRQNHPVRAQLVWANTPGQLREGEGARARDGEEGGAGGAQEHRAPCTWRRHVLHLCGHAQLPTDEVGEARSRSSPPNFHTSAQRTSIVTRICAHGCRCGGSSWLPTPIQLHSFSQSVMTTIGTPTHSWRESCSIVLEYSTAEGTGTTIPKRTTLRVAFPTINSTQVQYQYLRTRSQH